MATDSRLEPGLRHAAACLEEFDAWIETWHETEYARGARGVCQVMARAFRDAADSLDDKQGH